MNKALIVFLVSAILLSTASPSSAWFNKANSSKKVSSSIILSSEQNEVINFVNQIIKLSNERNSDKLNDLFSSSYISGDAMDKKALFEMIKETWTAFPQIKYSSNILKVDVNGDYASVESIDYAKADNLKTSDLIDDNGLLESSSHGFIYLRKYNNKWKIISDKILSEETVVKYGTAKTLNVSFVMPPQVKAGDDYTASVYTEIPPGVVAIASITKEEITHPSIHAKEVFRQISSEDNLLERLLEANTSNLNELATVSVGYSESTEDENASPDVKLSGLTVITKRVNIIPLSTMVQKKELNINTENSEPDDEENNLKDMNYENENK